jgi:hypothetical protein
MMVFAYGEDEGCKASAAEVQAPAVAHRSSRPPTASTACGSVMLFGSAIRQASTMTRGRSRSPPPSGTNATGPQPEAPLAEVAWADHARVTIGRSFIDERV